MKKINSASNTPVKGASVKTEQKRGGIGGVIMILVSTAFLLVANAALVYYLISFPTALDFYFQRVAQSGYNVPFVAVGAALALVLFSRIPVSVAMALQPRGFNNFNPRKQQNELTGWGSRAVSGHYNAIEVRFLCQNLNHQNEIQMKIPTNFSVFSVAVILATVAGVPSILVTKLSIIFVAARVVYHVLYLINLSLLRSMVYFISFACCGFLIFYAATTNQTLTKNLE